MEQKKDRNISSTEAENSPNDDELEELLKTLKQETSWDGRCLVKYKDYWCPVMFLHPILSTRKHFKATDTDIIQASMPKSGTTWLKALSFSIANRKVCSTDQTPLLTSNPHKLIPFLEFDLYWDQENPNLRHIPNPRIFSTHLSYKTLPKSILESKCRIIYISRNPLDHFISHRMFLLENKTEEDRAPLELDGAFDLFCRGIHPQGPFWEHILGYWNAHLKNPRKVLFLKYEDLKKDITFNVRKIAEFMGFPFSLEEEKQGLIEQISSLCSFQKLRSLEVNKTGSDNVRGLTLKNSSFFRKGEVGDWTNHLTPSMAERFKKVMESKFEGSGLTFEMEIGATVEQHM